MYLFLQIYPSEFGLQRLQEEEEKGPIELVESKDEEKELESGDDVRFISVLYYFLSISFFN